MSTGTFSGGVPYLAFRVVEPTEDTRWYLEWDISASGAGFTGTSYGVSLCTGNIVEIQAVLFERDLRIVDSDFPDGMLLDTAVGRAAIVARSEVRRVQVTTTPEASYCRG